MDVRDFLKSYVWGFLDAHFLELTVLWRRTWMSGRLSGTTHIGRWCLSSLRMQKKMVQQDWAMSRWARKCDLRFNNFYAKALWNASSKCIASIPLGWKLQNEKSNATQYYVEYTMPAALVGMVLMSIKPKLEHEMTLQEWPALQSDLSPPQPILVPDCGCRECLCVHMPTNASEGSGCYTHLPLCPSSFSKCRETMRIKSWRLEPLQKFLDWNAGDWTFRRYEILL